MFLLTTTALLQLLLTTTITALPSSLHPHLHKYPTLTLSKRGLPGAVYICTSPNFTGDCGWIMPSSAATCHIPGTGSQAPQSIGPDPGGVCTLYSSFECSGSIVATLKFPGLSSNLPTFGSLKCASDTVTGFNNGTTITLTGPDGGGLEFKRKGDPRLAGGVGSKKRKEVEGLIQEMERDGFREGMIGLEKGVYY
ncbi:hypothetical protein P154DRAFT_492300 [Amniculicola lignicola CBS 123094]|uniref:Uncharacterized protein n=1 Tax=Amniculicola lignicola CBS 123094 TaxID=1392246 RepID=A0A6A5WEC8_9PLEO|nr:hypothetical protein P154DRAFT_492300 [Amniculicola lignicola CBS 123094]